jgi:hypothetical protein
MIYNRKLIKLAAVCSVPIFLAACGGDDGADGQPGVDGQQGPAGANGLVSQTQLFAGNETCFNGGVQFDSGIDTDGDGVLAASEVTQTTFNCSPTVLNESENFIRIATFPVCLQEDSTCNTDIQTVAEIVAASSDGATLIYTDSAQNRLGYMI